jgi:hypothetical protein
MTLSILNTFYCRRVQEEFSAAHNTSTTLPVAGVTQRLPILCPKVRKPIVVLSRPHDSAQWYHWDAIKLGYLGDGIVGALCVGFGIPFMQACCQPFIFKMQTIASHFRFTFQAASLFVLTRSRWYHCQKHQMEDPYGIARLPGGYQGPGAVEIDAHTTLSHAPSHLPIPLLARMPPPACTTVY